MSRRADICGTRSRYVLEKCRCDKCRYTRVGDDGYHTDRGYPWRDEDNRNCTWVLMAQPVEVLFKGVDG